MRITKALMKQVLYQAYQIFGSGVGEIYTVGACREMDLKTYGKLIDELKSRGFIQESSEPDYQRITHTGEMFGTGDHCSCRECRPQDYR